MNVLVNRLVRRTWEKISTELESRQIGGIDKIKTVPKAHQLELVIPARVTRYPGENIVKKMRFDIECLMIPGDLLNPTLSLHRSGFSYNLARQKVSLFGMDLADTVEWADAVETAVFQDVASDVVGCIPDVVVTGKSKVGVIGKLPGRDALLGVDVVIRTRLADTVPHNKILELAVRVENTEVTRELTTLSDAWGQTRDIIATFREGISTAVQEKADLAQLEIYLKDTAPELMTKLTCRELQGDPNITPLLVLDVRGSEPTSVQVRATGDGFDMELCNIPHRGGVATFEKFGELAKILNGLTPAKVAAHVSAKRAEKLKEPEVATGMETSLELA